MTIGKLTEGEQYLHHERIIKELESANRALTATIKHAQESLRDQLAMAALPGLVRIGSTKSEVTTACLEAYEYADEALKVRVQPVTED